MAKAYSSATVLSLSKINLLKLRHWSAAWMAKWPMAVANVGCAVLSLAFALAYPQLIGLVIDRVIGEKQTALLAPVMVGLLGAFLLRDLFNSLRIRINNRFEQNVIYDMRREVYARLQRLPVNYFDQRASGLKSEWRSADDSGPTAIGVIGRAYDLIVMPQPGALPKMTPARFG